MARNIVILGCPILGCLGLACDAETTSSVPSQGPADASRSERTVGRTIDDVAITTKVKAALLAAKNVDGSDISVETNSGRVVLRGTAPDQSHIDRAVATARNVQGVRDAESRLVVGKG